MDMNSDLHEKENTAAKVAPEETGVAKTEAAAKDTTQEDAQSLSALPIVGRKNGLHLFFMNIRCIRLGFIALSNFLIRLLKEILNDFRCLTCCV